MNTLALQTPIGLLMLCEEENALCAIRRLEEKETACTGDGIASPLLNEAMRQLTAYFAGTLSSFDLPLAPHGTEFERAVWRALREIPYGQTRTYGQIAAQLGKPGAARAVGRACGKNPLLIVVPCHRVLGGGGRLTGFAAGLEAKRRLLETEGIIME